MKKFRNILIVIAQRRYNAETELAMQEARDIISGKIDAKRYATTKELFDELDNEY